MRESSNACLLGERAREIEKIRRAETQCGGGGGCLGGMVGGGGVYRQAERDRNRVSERRQRQTGREMEAERKEARAYLKRLCLQMERGVGVFKCTHVCAFPGC